MEYPTGSSSTPPQHPQTGTPTPSSPKRARKVSPSSPRIQEIASQSMNKQKISEEVAAPSQPHTEPAKRRQKFEERYTRVTTYFENGLHEKVKHLYTTGDIKSVTTLVNEALGYYLATRYQSA